MRDYRFLTDDEIRVLENNSCWAEDWQRVQVAEEFSPYNFHRVIFYVYRLLRSFLPITSTVSFSMAISDWVSSRNR